MTCESLNCFCVKENATVGFTRPAAKVMKFKIAHVQLYTKLQERTGMHAQCTNTLCITQLHNVHKAEDGTCGNKAQAEEKYRHTCTRSHWGDLGKSRLRKYTAVHIVEDPIEETWGNHSLCERISDSKAEASQKTSRPGNLANKLFKREVSTSPTDKVMLQFWK